MSLTLEIFLIIDALLLGALIVLAINHGLAHFRPDKHDAERRTAMDGHLSPEIKAKMQSRAAANFENIVDKYSSQLQKDLRASEDSLNSGMEKLSARLVQIETDRYQAELTKLRETSAKTGDAAGSAITSERAKIEADLAEQKTKLEADLKAVYEAEKQRRIDQLDTRLNDAVTSFLLETLGHEADLGAQEKYLLKMLDDHKSEIIEGVQSEA